MPRHWGWSASVKALFALLYVMVIGPVMGSDMSNGVKFLVGTMLAIAAVDELAAIPTIRLKYWQEVKNEYLRR